VEQNQALNPKESDRDEDEQPAVNRSFCLFEMTADRRISPLDLLDCHPFRETTKIVNNRYRR
jgi:hypothetical protein